MRRGEHANGDGEVDFSEFFALIKDVRAKANLFTGSEEIKTLSEAQMVALVTFDRWPSKQAGDQIIGGLQGFTKLATIHLQSDNENDKDAEERAERQANIEDGGDRSDPELVKIDDLKQELLQREQDKQMSEWYQCPEHGWRFDIAKAESIYVENPQAVEPFLENMRIKNLPAEGKRAKVLELAHRLIEEAVTAIPHLMWSKSSGEGKEDENSEPSKEELIVNRFGFLFVAYRVKFWWWEAMEMFRKLIMTSILVFVMPGGPGQLVLGCMITFVFLLLNLIWQPYCTPGLNSLASMTLIANFATLVRFCVRNPLLDCKVCPDAPFSSSSMSDVCLCALSGQFCGIVLKIAACEEANVDRNTTADKAIITMSVLLVNVSVACWPILRRYFDGSFRGDYANVVKVYDYLYTKVFIRCCHVCRVLMLTLVLACCWVVHVALLPLQSVTVRVFFKQTGTRG